MLYKTSRTLVYACRNAEKEIDYLILHISETMLYETSMDTCICLEQKNSNKTT